jgi:hypothetical protein
METTAVVGVVIAADRGAFQILAKPLFFDGSIVAINAIVGGYLGIRLRPVNSVDSAIGTARLASGLVSLINSLVIATIIAEGFRTSTGGEYFSWSRDWIQFAIIVVVVTIVSTACGMLLSMLVAMVLQLRRKILQ